jgi:mannitol/fructose-specific phosphotransferase system IIA component (Ntr-type)
MTVSSSTDDGIPIRCDFCGALSFVNVSRPPGDSVCPACGTFLWVNAVVAVSEEHEFVPNFRFSKIAAKTRFDAIHEITHLVGTELEWNKGQLYELNVAILKREDLGSTGTGRGFAVPHASVDWIASCTTAMAFAPNGIEFDSLDGKPVHSFILVVSPSSKPGDHLRTLERVSRAIRSFGQRVV